MNTHYIRHFIAIAVITVSAIITIANASPIAIQTPAATLTKPTSQEKSPAADGFIQR